MYDMNKILIDGLPPISTIELLPDSHEVLRRKMPNLNFEVTPSQTPENLSEILAEIMIKNRGIGLAANQVGFEMRAFCMMIDGQPQTLFNPILTELTDTTHKMVEGCLSFPDLYLNIARPIGCRINYQDFRGNRLTTMLDGIEARCAMHEIDHLNGVLFTSKVTRLQLKMRQKKLEKRR